MVRKRRTTVKNQKPQSDLTLVRAVYSGRTPSRPAPTPGPSRMERLLAVPMLFFATVPLILFALGTFNQLWSVFSGQGFDDPWIALIVIPIGLSISPVLFYLGWYFEVLAKDRYLDMEKVMGGHFRTYCQAIYAVLAAVTLLLAVIGILGSAFVDSSLITMAWVGTAFVAIGLVSWFFGNRPTSVRTEPVSLKPTGIVFALFSVIWLYGAVVAMLHQDLVQMEGSLVLFLIFLIVGILIIRLSSRSLSAKPKSSQLSSGLTDHD